MFLVRASSQSRVRSALFGEGAAVHEHVSILLATPFFFVEYTVREGKQSYRNQEVFGDIRQVVALMTLPEASEVVVQVLTPGWVNGGSNWSMAELAEVWVGAPLADSIKRAVRYVLRDGRTLLEGKEEPEGRRSFECVFRAAA